MKLFVLVKNTILYTARPLCVRNREGSHRLIFSLFLSPLCSNIRFVQSPIIFSQNTIYKCTPLCALWRVEKLLDQLRRTSRAPTMVSGLFDFVVKRSKWKRKKSKRPRFRRLCWRWQSAWSCRTNDTNDPSPLMAIKIVGFVVVYTPMDIIYRYLHLFYFGS